MHALFKLVLSVGSFVVLTGCMQPQPQKNDTSPQGKALKTTNVLHCQKYEKVMNHASKYIQDEFEKGYFFQKDTVGAKAQLFLIQSRSQTLFAQNINAALDSYKEQYNLAKKEKCDLSKFALSPLEKIQNTIKTLEVKTKEKK